MYERCELEGKIYTYVSYNPFSPPNTHISIYVQHTQTQRHTHTSMQPSDMMEQQNTQILTSWEVQKKTVVPRYYDKWVICFTEILTLGNLKFSDHSKMGPCFRKQTLTTHCCINMHHSTGSLRKQRQWNLADAMENFVSHKIWYSLWTWCAWSSLMESKHFLN